MAKVVTGVRGGAAARAQARTARRRVVEGDGLDAVGLAEAAGVAASRTVSPTHAARVSAAQGRKRLVLLVTAILAIFGVVMVASASSGTNLLQDKDPWAFMRLQLLYGGMGACAMWVAMRVPLSVLERFARPLTLLAASLMLLVFIPGLGVTAKGATRWLDLGVVQVQPSELVKFSVLLLVAAHLAHTAPPRHWWRDFLRSPGGVGLGLAALIFLQSDLGTAFVTSCVVVVLYVLAGTHLRLLAGTIGTGAALVALGIASESYRRERFVAFLDPWASSVGDGYQLVQALVAIGSGGPFGVGLGQSVQKIFFLPEAHTDMIFAIIVEELGLFGVALVLGSFAVLAVVGTRIAMHASTRFAALLAAGITAMVVGQAIVNLGGVVGLLPLTGVPLPLVSYGGSSLIVTLTALGLLANVAVQHRGSVTPDVHVDVDVESDGRPAGSEPAAAGGGGGHGGSPGPGARGR